MSSRTSGVAVAVNAAIGGRPARPAVRRAAEQLGAVAMACREHANKTPHAQMGGKAMTMDELMAFSWYVDGVASSIPK